MKKLLLILTLVLSSIILSAQNQATYVAFQPVDLGMGIRYDHYFESVGLYGSLSYGNYYLYRMNGLKDHVKLTGGIMIPFGKKTSSTIDDFHATIGLNRHWVNYSCASYIVRSTSIVEPWSFELGVATNIFKRFTVAFRTDILRWEPCIDIGLIL